MRLEVCVEDLAGLDAAVAGGADRIELCSALGLGGLTPSVGFMRAAAVCGVPVFAMIRPRAGDFAFSPAEVAVMRDDIAAARQVGLAGVVLGATSGAGLDVPLLAALVRAAQGMGLTLHRAFDLCEDVPTAVDQAVALGFQRILTSGGAVTALAGIAVLEAVFAHAAGRITIMPGAGIGPDNVAALRARLPLREVHASCAVAVGAQGRAVEMGFEAPAPRRTDAARVRALKAALGS